MQLKKYMVTLSVPVNVLVDAKDSQQAFNRAKALVQQQPVVPVEVIENYSTFALQSMIVDDVIREPEENSEPMIA